MRIGFVNFTPMIYDVSTPLNQPLGGSESAMCYLAVSLAKRGHRVILFGRKKEQFKLMGVDHLPDSALVTRANIDLDFLVIQNTPFYSWPLKKYLQPKTKLIFWTQHASDQPAVSCLRERLFIDIYDAFIYVSLWQKQDYEKSFPAVIEKKSAILRNAISPAFENLFSTKNFKKKLFPPVLAYTSTPFRGLDILITIFPYLKKDYPNITLNVYSSLKVYQNMFQENLFIDLYNRCKNTAGVNYLGSVSQKELAKELKNATILSYSNTFPETSCISAMEAMAAGCIVVTTNLGALLETTAGFGYLVDIGVNANMFCDLFFKKLVEILKKLFNKKEKKLLEEKLRHQVDFVNKNYIWSKRAKEWENFFLQISKN